MFSIINENIYDMSLILKVKKQTGPKKLKKIIKNLRNLSEEDIKNPSELKIKIFKEEKEIEKNSEFKIVAPIFGFQHYSEDIKKSNSKLVENINDDNEGEDTPSNVDENEEKEKQIDSSDLSENE